jgi:hypothetical protein
MSYMDIPLIAVKITLQNFNVGVGELLTEIVARRQDLQREIGQWSSLKIRLSEQEWTVFTVLNSYDGAT